MVTALRKWFVVVISLFVTMFFLVLIKQPQTYYDVYSSFTKHALRGFKAIEIPYLEYGNGRWRGFSAKQVASLSKLGEILYLDYHPPAVDTGAQDYTILIWKHGPSLERRHIKHYTDHRFDPFETCSVKNCRITYNSSDLKSADLVLFHLHKTRGVVELPTEKRNPKQIWTFLTDESPYHTFMFPNNNIKNYNGIFNWSMTYRMDSDIPVPYGRTVLLTSGENVVEQELDDWIKSKKQNVLVAIMGSNCGGKNHRWKYVKELMKYIPVDTYGGCGTLKCPGHFTKDCNKISSYKFYLSFENSNCDEYITEKLWWNGFAKNAIPIVMGGSKQSYQQFLPPNSFINVEDFAGPRDLANYIMYVNNTPSELEQYFTWKKYFKVVNEHGYFQSSSVHYCRICEALNYNNKKTKVYSDLDQFWSTTNCHESWDA